MLRNKLLKSCFAFALVLGMMLSSVAVHADSAQTGAETQELKEKKDTTVIEEEKAPLSNLENDKKTEPDEAKTMDTVFNDVNKDAWYAKELSTLHTMGLIQGYEDGTLRPDKYVTGKEFVTLLVRAGGYRIKPIQVADWFAPYYEAAKENGLLENIDIDLNKMITREEIAQLAYNFAKQKDDSETRDEKTPAFKDVSSINAKYIDAVTHLYKKEILKGRTNGTFAPKDMTKRSEIIAVVYRLLKLNQN